MLTGFLDRRHVQVFMQKGNRNVRMTFFFTVGKVLKGFTH